MKNLEMFNQNPNNNIIEEHTHIKTRQDKIFHWMEYHTFWRLKQGALQWYIPMIRHRKCTELNS